MNMGDMKCPGGCAGQSLSIQVLSPGGCLGECSSRLLWIIGLWFGFRQ